MSADPLGPGLLLLLLLALCAFVRAADAAVQEADEAELRKKEGRGAKRALKLLAIKSEHPGTLGMTHAFLMLAACALAEIWLSAPLAGWLMQLADGLNAGAAAWLSAALILLGVALVFLSIAGLFAGRVGANAGESALGMTAAPALACVYVLSPLTGLARLFAALLLKPFGIQLRGAQESVTEEEIRAMVDIGEEKGTIEADEKQMIENIFEFNNLDAEDCMIHRKDIIAIDIEDKPEDILRTIEESGLSRFPVYQDDIDSIIGILISRDYLINACKGSPKTLRELIRPAHFVPESVHSDVLFSEMQARKQHIAIVVDEYGGTSGLVTLEDLLEEIVGNIYDEFDPKEEQDVIPLGENRWRVSGQTELERLGEALGLELPEQDEFDTLGGLVYSQLTEIPADGDRPVVTCFGLRIQVEEISDRRVEWAIVEKLPEEVPAQ